MTRLPDDQFPIPDDIDRYLDMLDRLILDPGEFFTREWPESEWRSQYSHIQPEFLWVETLTSWAMWHGWERMLVYRGDVFEKAHAAWSYRPELVEILEIGRASILHTLNPLTSALVDDDVREIAEQFADKWAITDGDELAAAALGAKFGRTSVTAFVLAEMLDDDSFRVTGKMHYHVTGDPRNADLMTFMRHVDEWAALMTGTRVSGGGGQPATFETLQDMRDKYQEYRRSLPEGQRPKQWEFARKHGLTDSAIRKRLAKLEGTWADVTQQE